jgi:DNA-binding XRE family transcriptional regulator
MKSKNKFRKYLADNDITGYYLANLIGVSQKTIYALLTENTTHVPSLALAQKIVKALDVKIEELWDV